MDTVTLKNGTVEAKGLVAITMLTLDRMYREHPIALYEITCKSRDNGHQYFGNTLDTLKKEYAGLICEAGSLHGSIKSIILSAVKGEMLEMTIGSPIA